MMHTAPLELAPAQDTGAHAVMEQASGENFPVAMRVLSRVHRRRLLAVYGFARLADELGDELAGDRLAALDWLERELDRAYAGSARHPLLVYLQQTLAECALPRGVFVRLIDANRLDQRSQRYESWEQLQAYCSLSANPVGELVLGVFELASPGRIELSDRVCTALQLVEHIQDVGEDVRRGRYYLPAQDLARFDCSHEQIERLCAQGGHDLDLKGVPAVSPTPSGDFSGRSDRLRQAIAFEVARARALLAAGLPLVAAVHGRPKLALAGFVAGGEAALEAIERADFDVLGAVARPSIRQRVQLMASMLARSRSRWTDESSLDDSRGRSSGPCQDEVETSADTASPTPPPQ
ncbi:MAG TPA: squalene/phytoene synthase family protein [Solirubrobacteraceae bacterium]|jgi:squalene synthase HpnC|nr:squalene/phytoene synthase family protein [Solirubrobacteraceae bacterium]